MPFRFIPVNPGTDIDGAMSVMNNNFAQLDNESVTKTFKQSGGNAIVEGKLPYSGGYGSLYYDSDNVPRILIGIAPDGEPDIGMSVTGESIVDLYT
jgi:hypothetical protein